MICFVDVVCTPSILILVVVAYQVGIWSGTEEMSEHFKFRDFRLEGSTYALRLR